MRESLANINIFPDKNLVVTCISCLSFTTNDLMLTASSAQKSTIIFVLNLDTWSILLAMSWKSLFWPVRFLCSSIVFIESKKKKLFRWFCHRSVLKSSCWCCCFCSQYQNLNCSRACKNLVEHYMLLFAWLFGS